MSTFFALLTEDTVISETFLVHYSLEINIFIFATFISNSLSQVNNQDGTLLNDSGHEKEIGKRVKLKGRKGKQEKRRNKINE